MLLLLGGTLAAIIVVSSVSLDQSAKQDVAEDLRRAGRLFEDLQTYRQSLSSPKRASLPRSRA